MRQSSLQELEKTFKALSNINRLRLLVQLQEPKAYSEIQLTPSRARGKHADDRPISRQAVRGHVEELRDLGVVSETETGGRKQRFVVDRPKLYATVERMRELATVEPSVTPDDGTMELSAGRDAPQPAGPHLALARGVREGQTFPLQDALEDGAALVGRSREADICLGYDGFVSGHHAEIVEEDGSFLLEDLPDNKNGTFLNWAKLKDGASAPLDPGDVIGVGRSLLVFRK